jgi:O-acetyl-ADP-ribose deacetylase (regulator of RNase III)
VSNHRVVAVQGDITRQVVDVIVNAANRELCGGGGVDGAIWDAAGADEMRQACREIGGCETGDAVFTPAFELRAKWVIHTVGPVWIGGGRLGEPEQLASCYRNSLELADKLECHSIAFPAISTGVYGYPPELAADIAVANCRSTPLKNIALIRLVAFDADTLELYLNRLG